MTLLDLLEDLEWQYDRDDIRVCPRCGNRHPDELARLRSSFPHHTFRPEEFGHTVGCELDRHIKELRKS